MVLDSSVERNRLVSLVPPVHIAILDASRIYATLAETLAVLQSGDELSPGDHFHHWSIAYGRYRTDAHGRRPWSTGTLRHRKSGYDVSMRIISFATEESDWQKPRLGIILEHGGRDTGYRLDCERLFDPSERPSNSLSWFDMDGPWLQKAREVFANVERDAAALDEAKKKAGSFRAATPTGSRPFRDPENSSASDSTIAITRKRATCRCRKSR